VLEVVCLTCQETTPQALQAPLLQAPLLLALLLQRAAPGLRAAFLNSADGTRLLLALQQMGSNMEHGWLKEQQAWCFDDHSGALSGLAEVCGKRGQAWLVSAQGRTGDILTWCFLEMNPGAASDTIAAPQPAAAPAAAAAGRISTGGPQSPTAAWVTPDAVANGAHLSLKNCCWIGECAPHRRNFQGLYAPCGVYTVCCR
jgi:hypothetical protein